MKTRIHRGLSERIREGCEGRLNVCIHPRWFLAGNLYPDCSHQRLLHLHELSGAGGMVGRMVRRFCKRGVWGGRLSRLRSMRLGIIMHYVCDFSCYAHTAAFPGTLREHRAYERAQGALSGDPAPRDVMTLYGAGDAAEAYALFLQALGARPHGSYTPAGDLDFALSAGTELACAMLRLCLREGEETTRCRRLLAHVPLLRRYARAA